VDRYRVISADSHLDILPERWTHHVPRQYQGVAPRTPPPRVVQGYTLGPFDGLGRRVYERPVDLGDGYAGPPGTGSPGQRVRELDVDRVDAEVLFPGVHGPAEWRKITDNRAYRAVVRAYNEFLAEEYCGVAADRLLGLGVIPVSSTDDAVTEMEYCKGRGLRGVVLGAFPSCHSYPDPEDDRFWGAAVDLDMPVTVHVEFGFPNATYGGRSGPAFKYPIEPASGVLDVILRYGKYGFRGALHAVQLTWAGVFDRFPKFRIYFAETQIGWIPNFLEQMDNHYTRHQYWAERLLGLKPLQRLPSEYVKEHCYWGFQYNPVGVREMYREVGVDRIMWATDFPHAESDWPESSRVIQESVAGLPVEAAYKVVAGNAMDFFRLGSPE